MAITTAQLAQAVRLVANNVSGIIKQKNKIKEKMDALDEKYAKILAEKKASLRERYEGLAQQQELLEAPIKDKFGYGVEELTVTRTVDAGTDSRGNTIRRTVIELRYPGTIVPPAREEATDEPASKDAETKDVKNTADAVSEEDDDLPFAF